MSGSDPILTALAIVELMRRMGDGDALAEYQTLIGAECEHQVAALYLARLLLAVAEETGYNLQQLIDDQRADMLAPEEPGLA